MKTRALRWLTALAILSLGAGLLPGATVAAFPVASDSARYAACGRVFPDPQAYWPSPAQAPAQSPWAKGNGECRATDFIGWQEALDGLNFLAGDAMFGDFVEVYNLGEADDLEFTTEGTFADILDESTGEGMTAGLPSEALGREKVPMYLVRVTDEESTAVPIKERQHFAYGLALHGIERAGVEGGIRAVEDLATWASCEKYGDEESPANCAQEDAGPDNPHPILETAPEESTTAGEALREQSVWFLMSNPDGWRRGDKQEGGFFYQRYNGNGMDINRDWPSLGYTFRPYTPWSEPETRATGKVLQAVKKNWTGGIDLHGQLNAPAFSFTLIGGAERPFDKDRRVLQFTKGAWADAEQRLSWSAAIKPNDAPPQPGDPRMYGVQWGTIWDTIDYTVTGALGDWMDSPLGLNADAIDNEMSFSHLGNCGVGNCFINEFEQLHVDGNKSLIYAQMHYSRVPEDTTFRYDGKAAYLYNPNRVKDAGSPTSTAPSFTQLPPQEPQEFTINHLGGDTVEEFEVKGPDDGVYNGGIRATISFTNAQGVSPGALNEIAIDKYRVQEQSPERGEQEEDEWQTQNSYFNQAPTYAQAGAQIDANSPTPGRYRLRVTGQAPAQFNVKLEFLEERAWPDPGQVAYDVSNMDFFDMLSEYVPSRDKLVKVPVSDVLAGSVDLNRFDTVVAADDAFLPGFREERAGVAAQDPVTGSTTVPAPGAGERNSGTSGFFEFDVANPQTSLTATVSSATVADPDLYLQKRQEDGSWGDDVASGETGRTLGETLSYSSPTPGRYRLEVHNYAGAPGTADIEIEFKGIEEVVNNSPYTRADRDRMADKVKAFAQQGGNVVLTDNSLRAVEWMGLTPAGSVEEQKVYAGNVQFSADGGDTDTYGDPLAANVDQPGAAEGAGNRHQIAEPVPTGYAIQDETGGDFSSHPQWSIKRESFDAAKGRVAGMIGDAGVTLGEIPVGDGVVRVLGSLLPMPTEEFDHPYGLEGYAITYSGYEVTRNLLEWVNPNGTTVAPIRQACEPASAVTPSGFNDVRGNTHEANIECIAWYDITSGRSPTAYAPSRPVTREQMASYMANLAIEGGVNLPSSPRDAFPDDDGSIHEANINKLAEAGLIKGKTRDRYAPKAKVSREQMATFIAGVHRRVIGSLPNPSKDFFPDDNSSVHERNINALASLDIIQGRNGRYSPRDHVTRAQMASFIVHDLGRFVAAEEAYFGGADVALPDRSTTAGGELSGRVRSNKPVTKLVANGCGNDNQTVPVADDGGFRVTIGDGQSGQCLLTLTTTAKRRAAPGGGQSLAHRFSVNVTAE